MGVTDALNRKKRLDGFYVCDVAAKAQSRSEATTWRTVTHMHTAAFVTTEKVKVGSMTSCSRKHLGTRYRDDIDAPTVVSATARPVRQRV